MEDCIGGFSSYTKGVPQKLYAFDKFLETHAGWREKTVLIQVAVPTRSNVGEYQKLRREVNELIENGNGKHSTMSYTPIHFMHKSIGPDELAALYAISDACLISSTRDGLNLVSYEYVACQLRKRRRKGALVISKYAGVSNTLLQNSMVVVNPWDTDEFAAAIGTALEMSDEDQSKNHQEFSAVVQELTSFHWGKVFLEALSNHE